MKLTITLGAGAILVLGLAGCQTDKSSNKDFFPSDHKADHFVNVQTALGARKDATLQPHHFDGTRLNSLGEQKLAMLVPDDLKADTLVYLNLPDGDVTATRKEAVGEYLKKLGVEPARVKIEMGINPDNSTPAAAGLARLPKTESGTIGQEKSDALGYGGAAMDPAKTGSSK